MNGIGNTVTQGVAWPNHLHVVDWQACIASIDVTSYTSADFQLKVGPRTPFSSFCSLRKSTDGFAVFTLVTTAMGTIVFRFSDDALHYRAIVRAAANFHFT
jgi:hypothetical protein